MRSGHPCVRLNSSPTSTRDLRRLSVYPPGLRRGSLTGSTWGLARDLPPAGAGGSPGRPTGSGGVYPPRRPHEYWARILVTGRHANPGCIADRCARLCAVSAWAWGTNRLYRPPTTSPLLRTEQSRRCRPCRYQEGQPAARWRTPTLVTATTMSAAARLRPGSPACTRRPSPSPPGSYPRPTRTERSEPLRIRTGLIEGSGWSRRTIGAHLPAAAGRALDRRCGADPTATRRDDGAHWGWAQNPVTIAPRILGVLR